MGKTHRRGGGGIDKYKHETPMERERRHAQAGGGARVGVATNHPLFDVTAWERVHAEAEQQTLQLGPVQHGRSGRL